MATSRGKVATPPPIIGKAGRYTIFITPPRAPEKPSENTPPPVQPPPLQLVKVLPAPSSPTSPLGFFWDAVAKFRSVHSTLDEYLADWFGLNQSKYQWALNEYDETKGVNKDDRKPKDLTRKGQDV